MDSDSPSANIAAGALVVARHGSTVVVRCRREVTGTGWRAALPVAAGHVVVLVSAAACDHPELSDAVCGALRVAARALPTMDVVWLVPISAVAAPSEWEPLVHRVITDFTTDVVAPGGLLAGVPETGFYTGPTVASDGWFRISASTTEVVGTRLPVPAWESRLPVVPMRRTGVIAEPVTAGLVVRVADGIALTARHAAFRVPIDLSRPSLIVDSASVLPNQVGAVIDALAPDVRGELVVVPLEAPVASLGWISHLSDSCARDVVFATGVPAVDALGHRSVTGRAGGYRPFPTLIRHLAGGFDQDVLEVAPPPPGWRQHAASTYRLPASVAVADVVPSGLVLRAETDPANEHATAYDPYHWTVHLGVIGAQVTDDVLAAFEHLLASLDDDQLRTARLKIVGDVDQPRREHALQISEAHGVGLCPSQSPPAYDGFTAEEQGFDEAIAQIDDVRRNLGDETATHKPSAPTTVAMPARPLDIVAQPIALASAVPLPAMSGQESVASRFAVAVEASPTVDPADGTDEALTGPAGDDDAGKATAASEANVVLAETSPWPVRPSTATQVAKFTAAVGSAFTDGLSLVNSALAAWPALRRGDSGEKADFVAVCLYLMRGRTGAVEVNGALRAGTDVPVEAFTDCLVSGLGRLPVQRRPVLRQARFDPRWTVGTVLTDPGFVSASVELDVTAPGVDLDMLIWPASARRTGELLRNRQIDEAVFLPGRRFTVLATRADDVSDRDDDDQRPATALLLRELASNEANSESANSAALARLDRAWEHRKRTSLRLVDDADIEWRLTAPMAIDTA